MLRLTIPWAKEKLRGQNLAIKNDIAEPGLLMGLSFV